ncbi:EscU/YscU/HrcU family type III secretion system export apparatus switch protein, partial [Azospirillum brasilense]|uniref:EscU/YscU/HrcU family type III secretion system export apparatus switch protein n=1 Tax=Azospirillum brasilense TaxID=192 RepID=UPI001FFE7B9E
MSDGQDEEQKTEEPTEKRLREAMDKGDVPRARDVGLAATMAAAWLIAAAGGPLAASRIAEVLLPLIENPNDIRLDGGPYDVMNSLRWLIGGVAVAMLPVFGLLVGGAVVSAVGAGALLAGGGPIPPQPSHFFPPHRWGPPSSAPPPGAAARSGGRARPPPPRTGEAGPPAGRRRAAPCGPASVGGGNGAWRATSNG